MLDCIGMKRFTSHKISYGDERNDELHERHQIFLFRLRKRISKSYCVVFQDSQGNI